MIGGYLTGLVIKGSTGFLGSIVVATLGAVALVAAVRAIFGNARL